MNEQIQKLTDKIIETLTNGIDVSQILANPECFTAALIDLKKVQVLEEIRTTVADLKDDITKQLPAIIALASKLQR